MELTEEEVLQILRIFKESDFDQLHLEVGDLKLSVSKDGQLDCGEGEVRAGAAFSRSTGESSAAAGPQKGIPPSPTVARSTAIPEVKPAAVQAAAAEEGLTGIAAPMLGVFYSRPDPAAPPYVEVGQSVKADDTVGLIEVMKLFTSVKAGIHGTISRICVESGQLVEYGQTLFLVKSE